VFGTEVFTSAPTALGRGSTDARAFHALRKSSLWASSVQLRTILRTRHSLKDPLGEASITALPHYLTFARLRVPEVVFVWNAGECFPGITEPSVASFGVSYHFGEMPIANVAGTRECGTSGQGELSTDDSQ